MGIEGAGTGATCVACCRTAVPLAVDCGRDCLDLSERSACMEASPRPIGRGTAGPALASPPENTCTIINDNNLIGPNIELPFNSMFEFNFLLVRFLYHFSP